MSNLPTTLRLADFAAIKVSGAERSDFLQGQLTQDMHKVTADRAAPAAWCNRQGRVLCLMVAVEWEDANYLILPAEMSETCAKGLGRYILRAKVQIELSGAPVFGCVNAGATGDALTPVRGVGLLRRFRLLRCAAPRRGTSGTVAGRAA